jgi:hypothetical protein
MAKKKAGADELEDEVRGLLKKLAEKTASAKPVDMPPAGEPEQVEPQISGAGYDEALTMELTTTRFG